MWKKYIISQNPENKKAGGLDIISWLESKINNVNVQDVIREKYVLKKKEIPS